MRPALESMSTIKYETVSHFDLVFESNKLICSIQTQSTSSSSLKRKAKIEPSDDIIESLPQAKRLKIDEAIEDHPLSSAIVAEKPSIDSTRASARTKVSSSIRGASPTAIRTYIQVSIRHISVWKSLKFATAEDEPTVYQDKEGSLPTPSRKHQEIPFWGRTAHHHTRTSEISPHSTQAPSNHVRWLRSAIRRTLRC